MTHIVQSLSDVLDRLCELALRERLRDVIVEVANVAVENDEAFVVQLFRDDVEEIPDAVRLANSIDIDQGPSHGDF